MAEYTIDKFSYGGNTYKLQDNVSGYTKNTGTVTSVGISNATNGGLSVSGSPVTGSGSITVGHSNVLTSAQTTQAVYPIAIDKNGHISSYGTAVAVPNNSNWVNGSATGSVRTINASPTIGTGAVAEGVDSEASGDYSHAEGCSTASGDFSHSEGETTEANAEAAHAEGYCTEASGIAAHAEGDNTVASGYGSHTEGSNTSASGIDAHAEGGSTTASGPYAHAEGSNTTANHKSQHVFGEYNVLDTSTDPSDFRGTYVEIVGKGTSNNARSNARTLDWNGNETLAGKLTLGAAPTANMDAATKQYVDTQVATRQTTLVSGTNIKTVNGISLLGSGNVAVGTVSDVQINGTSILSSGVANIPYADRQMSTTVGTTRHGLISTGSQRIPGHKSYYDGTSTKYCGFLGIADSTVTGNAAYWDASAQHILFQQQYLNAATGTYAFNKEFYSLPAISSTDSGTYTIITTKNVSDITNTAYNASTNKVATMTDINNAMTVVTFTPDGTNNNLIISVQNPSSIQNGNEVNY